MSAEKTVEDFSKTYLSKKDRANIWDVMLEHTIKPPQPFTAAGIANELGVPYETVRRECVELEADGFIEEHEPEFHLYHTSAESALNFVRARDDFWQAVRPFVNFVLENYPDH